LNAEDVARFHQDGYLIVKNFFSANEISKLYGIAVNDNVVKSNATNVTASSGIRLFVITIPS
jgi:hypothetical protein